MQHTDAQPTEDLLDTQLAAYGRRAARTGRRRPSASEVIGYTAAAGGLAFAGGDALGTIQYSTSGFTTTQTNARVGWDIDGDSAADFGFFLYGGVGVVGAATNIQGSTGSVFGGAGVPALAPSFVVGPAVSRYFVQNSTLQDNYGADAFQSTTNYMGFRFAKDFAGTDTYKYGWAKVRVDPGASMKLTVSEWAWDDSGAAIKVGDTGAADVPAPATPLLTLLGLGAMGVAAYRRRREEGLKRLAAEQG